ncbi:butyrophilin subfamily 2 member A1-like [Misgurnus anguillicaudatus]|uniref:butyrophilin subfamily 2 member A1-like n=1 Tax=Misgurnus anguillicaudatus TaxID=75329 RepID=UPI003CCFCEE7
MEFICVTLMIIIGITDSTADQFAVVGPVAPLLAVSGEDVILPCSLKPNISAVNMRVEWFRVDLKDSVVHLYEDHEDKNTNQLQSYRGRTEVFKDELQKGNTSLKLSRVQISDEGLYKCFIQSKSRSDNITVDLRVEAVGSPPLITVDGFDVSGGLHLQCESKGWYPEPELVWLDSEGVTLTSENTDAQRETDGFRVKHMITVYNRDSKYHCRVKLRHHMMETEIITSSKMFNSWRTLMILISVGSVLGVIAGLLIAVFIYRHREQQRKDQILKSEHQRLKSEDQRLKSKDQRLTREDKRLKSEDQRLKSEDQRLKNAGNRTQFPVYLGVMEMEPGVTKNYRRESSVSNEKFNSLRMVARGDECDGCSSMLDGGQLMSIEGEGRNLVGEWNDGLTGRRVDDVEVLLAEIPPDSSLCLTTGLGLLPGIADTDDPAHRSTYTNRGISADSSPPGVTELVPPAWAPDLRDRRRKLRFHQSVERRGQRCVSLFWVMVLRTHVFKRRKVEKVRSDEATEMEHQRFSLREKWTVERVKSLLRKYAVNVTLDPDSAHPLLIVSDDGKQVRYEEKSGTVNDGDQNSNNKFNNRSCVLGNEGFTSGCFYYEVEVKGLTWWFVGVARESVERKGWIYLNPKSGYWVAGLRYKEYWASEGPSSVHLSVSVAPQRVGVFVDYEEGRVSFYDVESMCHIYSFTDQSFNEKLYPVVSLGYITSENSAPLIICDL